jgi:hypothetical protein
MRTIIVHAELPDRFWPWVAQAAAYVINRRPIARLNWQTPIAVLQPHEPSHHTLGPICVIRCKAYVLRKTIPKLEKLNPRAWIGYLISFQSNNI